MEANNNYLLDILMQENVETHYELYLCLTPNSKSLKQNPGKGAISALEFLDLELSYVGAQV